MINAAAGALVTAQGEGGSRLVFASIGGWASPMQRDRRYLVIDSPWHPNYEGPRRREPVATNGLRPLAYEPTVPAPTEIPRDESGVTVPIVGRPLRIRSPR